MLSSGGNSRSHGSGTSFPPAMATSNSSFDAHHPPTAPSAMRSGLGPAGSGGGGSTFRTANSVQWRPGTTHTIVPKGDSEYYSKPGGTSIMVANNIDSRYYSKPTGPMVYRTGFHERRYG